MKCGLLGRKLGHSYSPQIHSFLGNYSYQLYEKEPEEIGDFLKNGDFSAINVTIPYKKDVLQHCTRLTECAKRMGAVNTIVRQPDGSLLGHNTDYFGFRFMVERSGLNPTGKKVVVIGSGGASNTAIIALKGMGAEVVILSHRENTPQMQALHSDAKIIVNATPVGMYPNNGVSPVDLDNFPSLEGVLDMIYNPARTKLLMDAEKRSLITENGLSMLVAQAKEAAEWFTGCSIDDSILDVIHKSLRHQMENISIIGMPGSGKSHIGKLLAEVLNKKFIDTDEEIEKLAGKPIPQIFSDSGEEVFRNYETEVLEQLGKRSGLVIATGGGCVTKAANYLLLHQNSTVIWLCRDLNLLPTNGRPLSQAGRLEDMYKVRKPLYEAFSDFSVNNDSEPKEVVKQISTFLSMENTI